MELNYQIQEKDKDLTIHQILLREFSFSSRFFHKLLLNQSIFLNGSICDTRQKANVKDTISICFDLWKEDTSHVAPTPMDLSILYEDDFLLIVNKPAGIAIHPSMLHYTDTLSNGISYYFKQIHLNKKIRPVNRLDTNTSGIVIFAKCEYLQDNLSKQMQENTFQKNYLAICEGIFSEKQGTICLPIARKENSIMKRCISEDGQPSITHYQILKESSAHSLVKCQLETGRTHQIRVHMKAICHPLVGDTLYGKDSPLITRQALHCYELQFVHSVTKKEIKINAPMPDDMKHLIDKLFLN